jgi:hypothetical protein
LKDNLLSEYRCSNSDKFIAQSNQTMKKFYWTGIIMLFSLTLKARQNSIPLKVQGSYLNQVSQKAELVNDLIYKKSLKQLDWLASKEKKMQAKLSKIDPEKANSLFAQSQQGIQNLKFRLSGKVAAATRGLTGDYNSYLDTMQASVKFLNSADLLGAARAQSSIKSLQIKFEQSEEIGNYLSARRKEIQEQLSQYTAFTKDIAAVSKQAYYYKAQIAEYKNILSDREKIEANALELLRKVPAFQEFFSSNSLIAGISRINTSGTIAEQLEGKQTRELVEKLVQECAGTDPAARQALGRQLRVDGQQFSELARRFPDLKNSGEVPAFKPNSMKTKRTLARIKLGVNLSFDRTTYVYPTMVNIAFQAAYELNKRSSTGLGMAYKMGVRSNDKFAITSEGFGIRSFFDWQWKSIFYLNGGFELNRYTLFSDVTELKNWGGYQKVALAGVTIKIKVAAKYKSTWMIGYDLTALLPGSQVPFTSPVITRFGLTR